MSRTVDNLVALRILRMLVAPFTESEAFKLGIIDAHGKMVRKPTTDRDKNAYNYLTKLVFNMKKIINRLPGGENKIKSLVAALWLVKEHYESGNRSTAMMQEKFASTLKLLDNRVSLVEEEISVKKFLDEEGVANVTGSAVSTDEPKIGSKDIKKYKDGQGTTIAGMVRRKPIGVK
jgi:hypothetical protein